MSDEIIVRTKTYSVGDGQTHLTSSEEMGTTFAHAAMAINEFAEAISQFTASVEDLHSRSTEEARTRSKADVQSKRRDMMKRRGRK